MAVLSRVAAAQHGVFSAAQLRDAGFDRHAVQRRVGSAVWTQLDYRVFGISAAPATWEREMWIALLSRSAAVVGGRSAAFLHQLRGFRQGRPVIVVPGSANARSRVARIIRAEHFAELAVEIVDGFPTTSVEETLVCLASEIGTDHLESVFEDALLAHKLDLKEVGSLVEREHGRRRRGIVKVRRLLESKGEDAPSTDSSYLEGVLERVLRRGELPEWHREHPFHIRGQPSRVDVFIPRWQLVIEADGRTWHMRSEEFERDRQRDNELAARGIQVLRFTYRMLTDEPEHCLSLIQATGRVRRA